MCTQAGTVQSTLPRAMACSIDLWQRNKGRRKKKKKKKKTLSCRYVAGGSVAILAQVQAQRGRLELIEAGGVGPGSGQALKGASSHVYTGWDRTVDATARNGMQHRPMATQ
mmetsp:Transcript_13556/g.10870  ORF Transcript_13556/g.10870 Transcript_13556/m.10870 type:complete len:111 (-) Transcript_13556:33-365(-)